MYFIRKKQAVYVIYRDSETGRLKTLGRQLTREMDGWDDHNIREWIYRQGPTYECRGTKEEISPVRDKRLNNNLDAFELYLQQHVRDTGTTTNYFRLLKDWAVPYFEHRGLRDPNQWTAVTAGLYQHLVNKGMPNSQITRLNIALRKFWRWLAEEGQITTASRFATREPPPPIDDKTPLKITIEPEQILSWAAMQLDANIALMALLGYFFSLRPHELFGLQRKDFVAGSEIRFLECSKVMTEAGLYDRFAVHIQRQRQKVGQVTKAPKKGSSGWVACFNEQAARAIVARIASRAPDEFVINEFSVDWNIKRWMKQDRSGIGWATLKDLRRASMYWLGHYTRITPVGLKNHARHKDFKTTSKYLRRPEESLAGFMELDLDA